MTGLAIRPFSDEYIAHAGELLAARHQARGPNVWVEPAGHAVETAEDLRDLYAAAAARWVEEERVRHYAMVPASDARLAVVWWRLSFGQQHAFGICAVSLLYRHIP